MKNYHETLNKRLFLREAYCNMLEEYLDNLGIRSHWGKTLEWKMKKFPSEAKEVMEHWALLYYQDLNLLAGIDENGEVCSFLKLLEGEEVTIKGKRYENSLYSRLVELLQA